MDKIIKESYGVFNFKESALPVLALIPVPWDVTTSYGEGTHKGPSLIRQASKQLDAFHPDYLNIKDIGIHLDPISEEIIKKNHALRSKATPVIKAYDEHEDISQNEIIAQCIQEVNSGCEELRKWVMDQCREKIKSDQFIGLIGGEHSVTLGAVQALAEVIPKFGILQIDAHMDLRESFQGFRYSHASVMHHCLKLKEVLRLVQVGGRDYSEDEYMKVQRSGGRIKTFTDETINEEQFNGKTWASICKKIVNACPEYVYISCDVDGLKPYLSPNTGTPVPGGLTLEQVQFLLKQLVKSGRTIIGFDVVEVSPGDNEWDGNVGARLLFHLCGQMLISNKVVQA